MRRNPLDSQENSWISCENTRNRPSTKSRRAAYRSLPIARTDRMIRKRKTKRRNPNRGPSQQIFVRKRQTMEALRWFHPLVVQHRSKTPPAKSSEPIPPSLETPQISPIQIATPPASSKNRPTSAGTAAWANRYPKQASTWIDIKNLIRERMQTWQRLRQVLAKTVKVAWWKPGVSRPAPTGGKPRLSVEMISQKRSRWSFLMHSVRIHMVGLSLGCAETSPSTTAWPRRRQHPNVRSLI